MSSRRIMQFAVVFVLMSAVGVLALARQRASGPIRYAAPHNDIYSASIVVPHNCDTIYLPGSGAWKLGEPLRADFGDTETQTEATIKNIQAELERRGFSLSDVVLFRGTLAPDPKRGNKIDMEGYTRAYKRYFGTAAQPNMPVRATYQGIITVPGLLVEIEVIAAGHCAP
jgi:enamine deaminase RidA (YjgF/YER057c/UK114 family)